MTSPIHWALAVGTAAVSLFLVWCFTPVPAAAPQAVAAKISAVSPPEYGFFSKRLDYKGIPIKAHAVVADEALHEAYRRLDLLLRNQPNALANLVTEGAELHIIGKDQVTSDLPEHRHLKGKPFDGNLTVDERTRGLGGLLASCGEENLLKLPNDRYKGRDICVHEFAHTTQNYGFSADVQRKITEQYRRSIAKGLWPKAYAATNDNEFWAELTMWYFGTRGDLGAIEPKPEPGPEWLKRYDPDAYQLLDDIYSGRMKVTKREVVTLTALPASAEGMTRSSSATQPTTVRFVNRTDREVKVFWIDDKGMRKPYSPIPAGGRVYQETFVGHAWLLADEAGKALAVFVATDKPGVAILTPTLSRYPLALQRIERENLTTEAQRTGSVGV
jgi:hypothetical protein